MKIQMLQSVCTAIGAFNEGETYEVDDAQGKEFIMLHWAIRYHKSNRIAATKAPAKRKAVKKGAKKR
tara:strand:- start:104 stop:304 length:201 start_codon:yes stop_codon:yes gene_type:complete